MTTEETTPPHPEPEKSPDNFGDENAGPSDEEKAEEKQKESGEIPPALK